MGKQVPSSIAQAIRAAADAGVSLRALAARYQLAPATVERLLEQPFGSGEDGLQAEIDDPSTAPERRDECRVLIEDMREHARLVRVRG